MELSVIIPTRDRRATLGETLDRLEAQRSEVDFEAIVIVDGSTDGTLDMLAKRATSAEIPIVVLAESGRGPAAARNRGIAEARAPVCLSLDDDTWPCPGLLARHRDFHARNPAPEAALLGHVEVTSDPEPTPFMAWLAGVHLGYASIEDPSDAGGDHFFSGNVSAKTEFLRDAGGFDEGFTTAASDDIDLGLRLAARGMRLAYDRDAVAEHYHPTDLTDTIDRMLDIGRSQARLLARYPDLPTGRRPGLRHRTGAAALTALLALGVRTPSLQRETWRFLCHQACREGYWAAVDVRDGRRESFADRIRIGRTLARLAARDAAARMPPPLLERAAVAPRAATPVGAP